MEQNLVSDEELLERLNKVLHESTQDSKKDAEVRQDTSGENFQDVYDSSEPESVDEKGSGVKNFGGEKNLELENRYLSLQLQAEKKKAKELQSKFKLFENSVKYFERLNGQLETIKQAVNEDLEGEFAKYAEAMQKIRPKNIHTAASRVSTPNGAEDTSSEAPNSGEPNNEDSKGIKNDKEEVAFRDAEDFKQLEQNLEIVKDKQGDVDSEAEVFITKTEKRCLEDIGTLAARTRAPLDDKHQKYFERDRRRFANSIIMPEVQDIGKAESVPPEIISKTRETPVNITSTELDGLRSYLLQLKELIARRETAWARTTERDYNQRVEITRFKNEVSHLRMLCEKRQKDIKDRDQLIAAKDEEIKELQKRIQGLRNALLKLEKKDEKLIDTLDGMTREVLENSHIVQKSYNAMKRQSMLSRANLHSGISLSVKQSANVTSVKSGTSEKDQSSKKLKYISDKPSIRKFKQPAPMVNDEESRPVIDKKQRTSTREKPRTRHRSDSLNKTKETYEKVDEKLQKVEEMLHNDVFKGRKAAIAGMAGKNLVDPKSIMKAHLNDKTMSELSSIRKLTPSNSTIRQEMLTAMTGLGSSMSLNMGGLRPGGFPDPKKTQGTAAVIANALIAARNANMFNY